MEINLSRQFLAPVPLGSKWLSSLTSFQKMSMTIIIMLFHFGAVTSYVSLCIDNLYSVKVVVTRIEGFNDPAKTIEPTGIIVTQGFWHRKVINYTELRAVKKHDPMIHGGHFDIAQHMVNHCFEKFPRLSPLIHLAAFFAVITAGSSFFFLPFLTLFRVTFLFFLPFALMTNCLSLLLTKMATLEQMSCLREIPELWGRYSDGYWLLRSRFFEISLSFSGGTVILNSLVAVLIHLPASLLALLHAFFNRKHL